MLLIAFPLFFPIPFLDQPHPFLSLPYTLNMKFSLIAVAALAMAGMASAVHPTHSCTKLVTGKQTSLVTFCKRFLTFLFYSL